MLSRKNRLGKKDVSAIFAQGAFFSLSRVAVKLKKNDVGHNRFAVTISKKNAKNATTRSRMRRLFRVAIREMIDEMETGYDIVVIVKTFSRTESLEDAKKQLKSALKKAGLLVTEK